LKIVNCIQKLLLNENIFRSILLCINDVLLYLTEPKTFLWNPFFGLIWGQNPFYRVN